MSAPYPTAASAPPPAGFAAQPPHTTYVVTNVGPGTVVQSPPDYVLWSFFNAMFCNACCLGFVALVYSIKSRDRKVLSDLNGAATYGKTAKQFNIAVTVLFGICMAITLISIIATSASAR